MAKEDLIRILCASSFVGDSTGGTAYYGFVVYRNGLIIYHDNDKFSSGNDVTSNVAEYGTLIQALRWLSNSEYKEEKIELCSASQLVIRQINNIYQVKKENLVPLLEKIRELCRTFDIEFREITGKERDDAKRLSRWARSVEDRTIIAPDPTDDKKRWLFELYESWACICTISVQRLVSGQWINDRSELYVREFTSNPIGPHYNNFRSKFLENRDEYRTKWRVSINKYSIGPRKVHIVGMPDLSCFISYSSKDEGFAKRLHIDLEDNNIPCYFAEVDMKIGEEIRPTLYRQIRASDKLLLILSKDSIQSAWVKNEVETAFEIERNQKRRILFPVRIDDAIFITEEAWAETIRRELNIGDFTLWENPDTYKEKLDKLLQDLRTHG